jgi:hypothetical protein
MEMALAKEKLFWMKIFPECLKGLGVPWPITRISLKF